MKIEWTDAACLTMVNTIREHWPSAVVSVPAARLLLDAATAEQFRPETDKERADRLETSVQIIINDLEGVRFEHALGEARRALQPRGGEHG